MKHQVCFILRGAAKVEQEQSATKSRNKSQGFCLSVQGFYAWGFWFGFYIHFLFLSGEDFSEVRAIRRTQCEKKHSSQRGAVLCFEGASSVTVFLSHVTAMQFFSEIALLILGVDVL